MKKIIVLTVACFFLISMFASAYADEMNCFFPPGFKMKNAKVITKALSAESGIDIKPSIIGSYSRLLYLFEKTDQSLVYVGSFAQALIKAQGLGTPLVQNINGKEFYSGVLVYKTGENPRSILKRTPELIAYAKGSSSGESVAKAATNGKANVRTTNHYYTCRAVMDDNAKAGVVKNWWWDANKDAFPKLSMFKIPEISLEKNPDNILTASKYMPADVQKIITNAAINSKHAFGAREMVKFNSSLLDFPLELMSKGKIDPMTYRW